jgi:hypothetical protein
LKYDAQMAPPGVARVAALAVSITALAGCGDDETKTQTGAAAPEIAPGCENAVPGVRAAPPAGLIRPAAPLIVAASPGRDAGRVAYGYLGRSPSEVIGDFQRRSDVDFELIDTEGFEAEFVVSNERYRNTWRVRSACQAGSRFRAEITRDGKPAP